MIARALVRLIEEICPRAPTRGSASGLRWGRGPRPLARFAYVHIVMVHHYSYNALFAQALLCTSTSPYFVVGGARNARCPCSRGAHAGIRDSSEGAHSPQQHPLLYAAGHKVEHYHVRSVKHRQL